MIVVDDREEKLIDALDALGVEFSVQRLAVGDVWVGDFVVERKAGGDLEKSIIDRRVWRQLEQIRRLEKRPLLLLERLERFNEKVVMGFLASLVVKGIAVFFTHDVSDSALFLERLDAQLSKERRPHSIVFKKPFWTLAERQRAFVEFLPHVGPVLASRLLSTFVTVKALANASVEALERVPGVGRQKARDIVAFFNTPYDIQQDWGSHAHRVR
jgi:Fanconi anemia group M protein